MERRGAGQEAPRLELDDLDLHRAAGGRIGSEAGVGNSKARSGSAIRHTKRPFSRSLPITVPLGKNG